MGRGKILHHREPFGVAQGRLRGTLGKALILIEDPMESRASPPGGTGEAPPLLHHLQQARDAFAKGGRFGDQAQHEMAFVWKIVEVSRVHDDTHLAQEIDG